MLSLYLLPVSIHLGSDDNISAVHKAIVITFNKRRLKSDCTFSSLVLYMVQNIREV